MSSLKLIGIMGGITLGVGVIMLALIGALFLFNTAPDMSTTKSTTCDDIIRYPNGRLVCEANMLSEDEDITITRTIK